MQYKEKLYLARNFRTKMTVAEKIFWENVRRKAFCGLKFKRQYVIDNFIVDFYCHKYRLAIEIDGKIHNQQKIRDKAREKIIKSYNIQIIRFTNQEVQNNVINVLKKIKKFIKIISSPSPDKGEGDRGGEVRE